MQRRTVRRCDETSRDQTGEQTNDDAMRAHSIKARPAILVRLTLFRWLVASSGTRGACGAGFLHGLFYSGLGARWLSALGDDTKLFRGSGLLRRRSLRLWQS